MRPHLQLLGAINTLRLDHGLNPLRYSSALHQSAEYWLRDGMKHGVLNATGHGRLEMNHALNANRTPWGSAALLISSGQQAHSEVLQSWLNDTKMRDQLLDASFKVIGGAQANHSTKVAFWVVLISDQPIPEWLRNH
jgi:uncharacterized protein YkwD